MNLKFSDLTLVGWLLVLLTIGAMLVVLIPLGPFWNQLLPAGRYPAILLGAPALITGIAVFSIGAAILNRIGLPVVKRRADQDTPGSEPKQR